MSWRSGALCASFDPELFFPTGDGPLTREQEAQALAVCDACPVRAACLRDALGAGEAFGVWGGTTELDRRALRAAGTRLVDALV